MLSLVVEEIRLTSTFTEDLALVIRCSCGKFIRPQSEIKVEYRSSNLTLNFVVPGWECENCQSIYSTADIMEEINILIDKRLVALGLRPPVNYQRVAQIKLEEGKARVQRFGIPPLIADL